MTICLVLGGARSGKSRFAERRAASIAQDPSDVTYVATARPAQGDRDFDERIAAHVERRPAQWTTVDELDLVDYLAAPRSGVTLVDDLGTWLTHAFDELAWEEPPTEKTQRLVDGIESFREGNRHLIIVSPEVGLSVVPDTRAGRLFQDSLGALNEHIASAADEVFLIVAGLPLTLKTPPFQ